MSFASDKAWEHRYFARVNRLCATHLVPNLFGEAPFEEDTKHNTDLMVLQLQLDDLRRMQITCRIRRYLYAVLYPDQFTIRYRRPSGLEVEWQKMLAGWGTHFFYGFAARGDEGTELAGWLLGDLNCLRQWAAGRTPRALGADVHANEDGSSDFAAFDIDRVPADFIIAREAPATGGHPPPPLRPDGRPMDLGTHPVHRHVCPTCKREMRCTAACGDRLEYRCVCCKLDAHAAARTRNGGPP